ncbi:putative adhesin [Frankia sp. AgPm24]|uniref:putative adhesin n=1 Tax=Frankia sp. AgPm24 TaxID=631128 RepID=UPI0035B2E7CD
MGVVAAGVGLCFVPGGQAIGAGILIGAATSGGIGLVTGHFDPRAVAIGGIAGAVGGGVGQATSRLLATGPSYLVAAESGAAAGSAEDLAAQQLAHPGHINLTELAISSGTGGLAGAGGRAFARRAPLTQGAPETSHALPPATGGIDSLPAPPRPVFAGHGQIRPGDASTVTIPEGTSLTMYIRHGMPITDDLGYAIETNDVATMKIFEWLGPNSYEKFTYPAGSSIPDYSLIPGSDLHIAPTSRTVNRPTRLSELLEPNMGDWHWAACRVVQGW